MSYATEDERYFVSLVNATRKELGLQPLQIATSLNEAADSHTRWMLSNDIFSHTGTGGSKASDRIEDADFPMHGESWGVRENLAYVQVSGSSDLRDEIRQLHQNLLNSPEHYKAIVDPKMEYIGIGLETGEFDGRTVLMATQNFGRTTGNPKVDKGLFPRASEPKPSLEIENRKDWLADEFNGDVIQSDKAASILQGSARADDFRLGSSDDYAQGNGGNDWISGGNGDDSLLGGAGRDHLMGGLGDDMLWGGTGKDVLVGAAGNDTLKGQEDSDLLRGGSGDDELSGNAGHDTLAGESGDDHLLGGDGNDRMLGGSGNDILRGSAGTDTLIGGTGDDSLFGGAGRDTFVFHKGLGADRIYDYEAGVDRLLFDDALLKRSVNDFYEDVVQETASGVVINFGDGHSVTINGKGLTAEEIASDIFVF